MIKHTHIPIHLVKGLRPKDPVSFFRKLNKIYDYLKKRFPNTVKFEDRYILSWTKG